MAKQLDGQPFTCANKRFHTDVNVGKCVGVGSLGSVFPNALVQAGYHYLWLEKIIDTKNPGRECYWLIWYFNNNGMPEVPAPPVLDKNEVAQMQSNIALQLP